MKIKTKKTSFSFALKIKAKKHLRPGKPWWILGAAIRLISIPDLMASRFSYTESRMEEAGDGPYLILMNHSSFIDLEIAYRIFFPKPFCTVCTSDGFVGKDFLMRKLGCIPTNKFVTDVSLISDMSYAIKKKGLSVLMYPEASYTFDGTATPLPKRLGVLIKKLGVPVVTVLTSGAFLRQPLYNCLKKRKVKVSAHVNCLFSKKDIEEKSAEELSKLLDEAFTFDNFARQYQEKIEVTENFRADGLERILYKCPDCLSEGQMEGRGVSLVCKNCGREYEMDVFGRLKAKTGETRFPHIPDWYRWQRSLVKEEIERGEYLLDTEVEIGVLADRKAIYMVGDGRLIHNNSGFTLTGCDGLLSYTQSALSSYGLYADYYWYEIGDIICIGNKDRLYYCFPKGKAIVAKARLAAEELYKHLNKKTETV